MMEEDNFHDHEQKQLNPTNHNYSEKKNQKKINNTKSSTIQFYIIVIIIVFLIYRFCFPSFKKSNNEINNQDNKINNASKSKKFKL